MKQRRSLSMQSFAFSNCQYLSIRDNNGRKYFVTLTQNK